MLCNLVIQDSSQVGFPPNERIVKWTHNTGLSNLKTKRIVMWGHLAYLLTRDDKVYAFGDVEMHYNVMDSVISHIACWDNIKIKCISEGNQYTSVLIATGICLKTCNCLF